MALQFQRGQLASLMPGTITGYGGGAFNPGGNGLEQVSPLQQPMPPQQPEPKKPGAFGKGGDAWKIMGIIGDALQTAGGGQATYAPYMQQLQERISEEEKFRQRLQAQAQQKQQEREAALRDRKEILDYQRENPMPDSFARALQGAGINPESPEGQALYRQRAEMLTNPVQLVPDGMGGYQAVRPNESGGGLPQGYDPSEWELVPGDAGGNASGGF